MESLKSLVAPHRLPTYLAVALLLLVPWLNRSLSLSLASAFMWSTLALSYNVLLGYAGVASFGHAVPFGVGAFLTALALKQGLPYLLTLPLSGLAAALIYAAVGFPAYRVRGIYYAILTLAIAEAIRSTIESTARTTVAVTVGAIQELTSAYGLWLYAALLLFFLVLAFFSALRDVAQTRRGRLKIVKLVAYAVTLGALALASGTALASYSVFLAGAGSSVPYVEVIRVVYPVNLYMLSLTAMLLSYLFLKRFSSSPLGTSLLAVRENPLRASVLGYNVSKVQIAGFIVSGFFAGLAGGVYTALVPTVMTNVFGSDVTFTALLSVVIGGLGTSVGPVVGGVLTGLLRDFLYPLLQAVYSALGLAAWFFQQAQLVPSFLLGVIYIAVVLGLPYGIWGTWLLRGWKLKRKVEELLGL